MSEQMTEEHDFLQEKSAHWTDLPVGEILKRTRLHYGRSLEDVVASLHIRTVYLAALEKGRSDLLPGRVYAIGFVRSYAEYLGLNPDRVVHLFKNQSAESVSRPALHFPVPASESKLPDFYVLGASFIAIFIVVIGVFVFSKTSDPVSDVPPVSVALRAQVRDWQESEILKASELAVIETASGVAMQSTKISMPEYRVEIKAIEDTWMEITRAGGDVVFSRILRQDHHYIVPNDGRYTLDTGNIGTLAFIVDSQMIAPLGAVGKILRNVVLDADTLKPKEASMVRDPSDSVQP